MQTLPPQGYVHEISASIQGEGLYCGQAQTFVRFAGCNLSCGYCDTIYARQPKPGSCSLVCDDQSVEELPSPVDADTVVRACLELSRSVVAITGGEPLVQVDFLAATMRLLRQRGHRTYLETNGTLYRELETVVLCADVIAMDVKLPSATGLGAMWQDHERFLQVASRTEVFVKAVVTSATSDDEVGLCADLVANVGRCIPLVIQPASTATPSGEGLVRLQRIALEVLDDVRVIPQVHKELGLR